MSISLTQCRVLQQARDVVSRGLRQIWRGIAILSVVTISLFPVGPGAGAQTAAARAEGEQSARASEAELSYLNRPIHVFRASIGAATPRERAERAHARLSRLDDSMLATPIAIQKIELGDRQGFVLTLDGNLLFGVVTDDADPLWPKEASVLAAEAKDRLEEAFAARLAQRRVPVILRGVAFTLLAAGAFTALSWLIWRIRLRAGNWLTTVLATRIEAASDTGFPWKRFSYALVLRLVEIASAFVMLVAGYVALTFSMRHFPVTRPLADTLGDFFIGIVTELARTFFAGIPGLVTAFVIFLIAQALSRSVSTALDAAESGRIRLPLVEPDTAQPTRRLLRILIWGIALAAAYPYIPGSGSLAFQGLSVLFGLMITLGSTGIVSQLMSGMVLAYSRALHTGDFVRIGDSEGVVSEVGAISTKLVTNEGEEITIPNSVLIENSITNSSHRFPGQGSLVSTKITIGYDTPWRQVHAMLRMAADQTAGLKKLPEPYVLQQALSDFYVQYELFAVVEKPAMRSATLSSLHGAIQDIFNEHGVQIMSPQFYEQPPQPLIVPKDRWFTPPAKPQES